MAEHGPGLTGKTEEEKRTAFQEIVDRYGNDLYRLALSLVGNPEDAEDLLQETYMAAFEGLGRFKGRSNPKTWLIGILTRRTARLFRYRRIRRTLSLEWLTGKEKENLDSTTAVSPGSKLEAGLDARTMLATLPEKQREVLVLREVLGLSYAEIGEALNVPLGTVESRLFRAREMLREGFKDYFSE